MKRETEEIIMAASKPSDIFTMDAEIIEQEKEEYIKRFKPKAYNTIKNFIITQKITLLYREALIQLGNSYDEDLNELSFTVINHEGKKIRKKYNYHYVYDIRIGRMYVTESNVIFVIAQKHKKYYENYIEKTNKFPRLDKEIWKRTEYMLPKVSNHFQTLEGDFVIFIDKNFRIYPLREILNYFDGNLKPEYVASILTRLYYFECYMDLIGMNHNGITIDNLFFSPGRTVEAGQTYTIDDMRIVGVFGGWFFATWSYEKISGIPKEVNEILPSDCKRNGFSSFEVDELSIKRVARELLGDSSGKSLSDVPEAFLNWVNNFNCEKNAYEEYCAWEKVIKRSFGAHRFVDMDVSID